MIRTSSECNDGKFAPSNLDRPCSHRKIAQSMRFFVKQDSSLCRETHGRQSRSRTSLVSFPRVFSAAEQFRTVGYAPLDSDEVRSIILAQLWQSSLHDSMTPTRGNSSSS